MSSRRSFVRKLALMSVAVAVAPRGAMAAVSSLLNSGAENASHPLSARAFAPYCGESFTVRTAAGVTQAWTLEAVQKHDRGPQLENFSLRFTGSAATAVPQGMYRFAHASHGEVELFVVAHPIDARTVGYEAVINRLV